MNSFDPLYSAAVDHLNQGNLSEAIDSLEKCLRANPHLAPAYELSGDILQSQGRIKESIGAFKQSISLAPDRSAATHNKLGIAFISSGKVEEAIESFQTAISIDPEYASAYYNLGLALAETERVEEAIASFRKTLELDPERVDASLNLSTLLLKEKQLDSAIDCLQELLSIQPDCADAYYNLGSAFYFQNELDEALICLEASIEIQPDHAESYCLLGNILGKQERYDEAINCLLHAVELKPDYAETHYHIANTLLCQERIEEAIICCEKAISLKPDYTEAYYIYANALSSIGNAEAALENYQKVIDREPENAIAYRTHQLFLPIIYRTEAEIAWWRQRFSQGLQNLIDRVSLDTEASKKWALESVEPANIFFLTYQAQNDLELQTQYSQLLHRVIAANYPQWAEDRWQPQPRNRNPARKIRVGYLSNHFNNHSVARALLGWFEHHDRERFEIYCYHIGKKVDAFTDKFKANSDVFRHINEDFNTIFEQLAADRLDILVFADLGMCPRTSQIAALRFAPVQCTCWGHPISSGLPTIDYYLSSELMEPEDHQIAQSHYTEQLIRLPKLGVSFPKPSLPNDGRTRADFQMPEQSVIYLCCQSLFKYLPQHDYIFASIAQQVPQAHFVFVARPRRNYLIEQFQLRLQRAFADFSLDSQSYCTILPHMEMDDYLSFSQVTDIFLDTIGFSGGCTSFDAIACNLPIVTMPGEFMRGRHAYAILQASGVTDTIAYNEAEYIKIAVKLGLDREWRQQIVDRIADSYANVYDDRTCVVALEDFFSQVYAAT